MKAYVPVINDIKPTHEMKLFSGLPTKQQGPVDEYKTEREKENQKIKSKLLTHENLLQII